MKKTCTITLLTVIFLSVAAMTNAQDSSGVKKQINASNEKADNLHGKKIQQQTLSAGKFEKLDTAISSKPVVKSKKKSKRKHQ